MAIQQTRYTYPSVESKLVRLKYRHGQKYHLASYGYGGVELDATQAKVYFWRYVGRRKGRFSIAGYNPSNLQWGDVDVREENLEELMRLQGFELAGVALGIGGSEYEVVSGTSNTIGYGEKTFVIGFNLAFKPGMRVRISDTGDANNYMEGTICSYSRNEMVMIPDTINGSGTYTEWDIAVQSSIFADDSDWDTSLYTDINTWNPIFSKPGLYADTWIINSDLGQFGPTVNYFRLEANLQGALWDIPRHHFKCDVWPSDIPFPSEDYTNPDFDMMVGVTPYLKNVVNPASYQVFQTLMSTMYAELIEIWFYRHETQGELDPPVKVTFDGPIQFTEQVFNFFWGKVPPTIFAEPGEYRLKFRVRTDQGAPTMDGGQYHDFWKTVNVNRSVKDISDPISQCYKSAINVYGSLSQCSYFLQYDDAGQHLTHLAKGSASDFLEPRDKEVLYDTSQVKTLNIGITNYIGVTSEVELQGHVSDHFVPLVIKDGLRQKASEPIRGYGIDGAVVRDFTVEGNKIILSSPSAEFVQVIYGYNEVANDIGRVEVVFRDYSTATVYGSYYSMPVPNKGFNDNMKVLFIQDLYNPDTRLVVPPDKFFINGFTNYLLIDKTWLESVIAPTVGVYYFRVQLYASTDHEGPIVLRSHTSWMSTEYIVLPGNPRQARFPEMIFRQGKPQFRHYDYGLFYQGTSTTSITVGQGVKTFTTQANKPFYQGAMVVCYSPNGHYMKGRILSYSGTTLRVDVTESFGDGVTKTYWSIYMLDIDVSNIDFYFSASLNENLFFLYDAEL